MKSLKKIIIILFVFFVCKATAQDFKLGKVSIAELEEKRHPSDTTAAAAVLFKKGAARIEYSVNEGFFLVTEVEARIKIYKKEGSSWANLTVAYYTGSNDSKEKVDFSDVYTYNLVGGKIEKTKLKSDGIFTEEVNKYTSRKKITLPNVKEGSVLEYSYSIRTNNIGMIRGWAFQNSIPVNYSQYETFIPEYYIFNTRQKGYIAPKVTEQKKTKSVVITTKETTGFGVNISRSSSTDKYDYIENQAKYVTENLPAMKEEAYVNNIDNYTCSLEQELAMIKHTNKPSQTFSTDWKSVVKTIYNYDGFGPELNKTGYFEDDLKSLLAAGLNTPEEKIIGILNHVKANVNWDGNYSYECSKGVRKAYQEKTGNVAEINLMLTAMLRHAGLTANPVLVSTRSNGIAIFPNRTAFNYVIAAVETSSGLVLLDASDRYSSPNILPFRALNWFGRLIRKDGTSEEVDLMPKRASNDVVSMSYSIDPTGKITGKSRRQASDHRAIVVRQSFSALKEDEYLEKLENDNNKIEISEYTRTNENDILQPVSETYSFTGSNFCEIIGGKIYFSPMLFFTNEKNPFTQEERLYPVDYGYPSLDRYNITIQIPEGYAVESLPAPALLTMADNVGSFKYNISANENTLQLAISHQINEAIVSSEDYEMLKDYYQGMVAKETEKIVLKKI
jgi:transglutaminase-like putative cysteine protease